MCVSPFTIAVGPFEIKIEFVRGVVYIPLADAGRAAADLGKLQAFGTEKPLHVRCRRADIENPDDVARHLAYLGVARRVDTIRGHHLRRNPAFAHRFEDIRIVVRYELMPDTAVDRQRIDVAFMTFDKFLDGDGMAVGEPRFDNDLLQALGVPYLVGPRCAGAGRRLDDQREADGSGEIAGILWRFGTRRLRAGNTGVAQRFLHCRLVATKKRGACRRTRNPGGFAHGRNGHDMCLDGCFQAIDPHLFLYQLHRLEERGFMHDRAYLHVFMQPAFDLRVEVVAGSFADANYAGARRMQCTYEFALIAREGRFDKNNVHDATRRRKRST